jgi:chromosome segregation ATPase
MDTEAQQEEIASLRRQLEQLRAARGDADAEELRQLYESVCLERDELEQKLAEKAAAAGELGELRSHLAEARAQVAEERTARARVEEELDEAQRIVRAQKAQATQAVIDKLQALEADLSTTREERDALEVKLAERAGVSAETTRMREELHQAQQAIEAAHADQAALRAEIEESIARAEALAQEKVALAAERQDLDHTLQETRSAAAQLRKEFEGLKFRYEPLAQRLHEAEVEAEEALAAQVRLQGQVAQKKRLEEEITALADRLEEEADQRAAERRACLEELETVLAEIVTQAEKGPGSAELEAELARLQAQCEALESDRAATREELRRRDLALETARRTLSLQTAEMDALRDAAASQVASASVQAGELEFYVGQLESALEISRAAGRDLAAELQQLTGRFTGALADLDAAAQRVAALADLRAEGAPPPRRDEAQVTFFDVELFREPPEELPLAEGQEA